MRDKGRSKLKEIFHLQWECLKRNAIYKKVCKSGHFSFGDERNHRPEAKIARLTLVKTFAIFGDVFNRSFDDWIEKYYKIHIKPDTESSVWWCSPSHIGENHHYYNMGFEKGYKTGSNGYHNRFAEGMETDSNEQNHEKEAINKLHYSGATSIKIDLTQSNERIMKDLKPLIEELRTKVHMDIQKPEILRSKGLPGTGNFNAKVGFHRLKVFDTYNDVIDEGGYRYNWIEVVKRIGTDEDKYLAYLFKKRIPGFRMKNSQTGVYMKKKN